MDTVALVGRLLVSLAAVLGVMWLIARRMRKGGRGKNSKLIDVIGRQQLSRNASVAVVRVLDQALIVGVTDGRVTVLGEADLDAVEALTAAVPAGPARSARSPRPARPARGAHTSRAVTIAAARSDGAAPTSGRLSGSALSPQTWKQTIESLRDLTSRAS